MSSKAGEEAPRELNGIEIKDQTPSMSAKFNIPTQIQTSTDALDDDQDGLSVYANDGRSWQKPHAE